MVKKFLVIVLALAIVAPSVQANVAQQVQAQAEARLVEVTGQALTVQDKEVLKVAVETALEDLSVVNESKFIVKNIAIAVGIVLVAVGAVYGVGYLYSGEVNPFSKKFITSKAENKKAKELGAEAVNKEARGEKEEPAGEESGKSVEVNNDNDADDLMSKEQKAREFRQKIAAERAGAELKEEVVNLFVTVNNVSGLEEKIQEIEIKHGIGRADIRRKFERDVLVMEMQANLNPKFRAAWEREE